MVLRIMKTCPSASYLSRHEAWMLWLQLMLARIPRPIGRSKGFISLSPSQAQSCPWFISGSSLILTAARITNLLQSSHQPFPPLPNSTAEFISTGLNIRPSFFGCFPTQNPPEYPIVIYLPNSPPLNGDTPVIK